MRSLLGWMGNCQQPQKPVFKQVRGCRHQRLKGPSTGRQQGKGRKLKPESPGVSAPARPRLGSPAPALGQPRFSSPRVGWVGGAQFQAKRQGREGSREATSNLPS